MRMPWLLFTSLLLFAWALLLVWPAHAIWSWLFAVGAGAFGHLLAVLALLVAGVGVVLHRRSPWLAAMTACFGVAAAVLFLRPIIETTLHRPAVEVAFGEAFPSGGQVGRALRWPRLFDWLPGPGPQVETYEVDQPDAPAGLPLDFYRAKQKRKGPAPCVIVIHGGGWEQGGRNQFRRMNLVMANHGYAVAAISYRLAPEHPWPAQRDDTLAAIAWIKAHAEELGVDPQRLILFGRSAGGQIATAVGYGARDPAIRGVIAFYAPHNMRFVWSIAAEDDVLNSARLTRQLLGGAPEGREDLYASASGEGLVVPGETPPTLLIHGELDQLVWAEHSRRLAAVLRAAGVPVVHLEVPWGTHALDFHLPSPGGQLAQTAVLAFLQRVVARTPGKKPASSAAGKD